MSKTRALLLCACAASYSASSLADEPLARHEPAAAAAALWSEDAGWDVVAPGVWRITRDGWERIHARGRAGFEWVRARLEAELARVESARADAATSRRIEFLRRDLHGVRAALASQAVGDAAAPDPDLPPGGWCEPFVFASVNPRAVNNTQPGATASAAGKRCNNQGWVSTHAIAATPWEYRSDYEDGLTYANSHAEAIGFGEGGCAGEASANITDDYEYVRRLNMACW